MQFRYIGTAKTSELMYADSNSVVYTDISVDELHEEEIYRDDLEESDTLDNNDLSFVELENDK